MPSLIECVYMQMRCKKGQSSKGLSYPEGDANPAESGPNQVSNTVLAAIVGEHPD